MPVKSAPDVEPQKGDLKKWTAVVLAGGKSTRMGRDKTHLPHPQSNLPLVVHQLSMAQAMGISDLLVSAHHGQELPALPDTAIRVDDAGNQGPLAGIVAALAATQSSHLVVIPVDLPFLQPQIYTSLASQIADNQVGAYAQSPQGIEPLVSIVPNGLQAQLIGHMRRGQNSPRQLFSRELATVMQPVGFSDSRPFQNWNRPNDMGELKPQ